jgi:NADPH:quinone reductase-like Zn-dependent oxidoreductase
VGVACQTPADVVIVREDTVVALPQGISCTDAAALSVTFLSAWIGLVVRCSILASSIVLVHDGTSGKLEISV